MNDDVEDIWEAYWERMDPEFRNPDFQVAAEKEAREWFDSVIRDLKAQVWDEAAEAVDNKDLAHPGWYLKETNPYRGEE